MSRKIFIEYDYLQSWDIWSNTALREFGQPKSDLQQ